MIVLEVKKDKVTIRKANTSDMREAVYTLLMLVPPGKTTTYGDLARILGLHPRVVARFMALNNNPIIVPCHRVIMSNGKLGGFSLGGPRIKEKLLRLEGVEIIKGKVPKDYIMDLYNMLK